MVAADHPIPSIVENVFNDAVSEPRDMYPLRRPLPPKPSPSPQRASWGNSPNYKEIWENSLKKNEGRTPPRRAYASLPPRRPRASPPMSPLLGASCSLYDEFYPWRGDAVEDYCSREKTHPPVKKPQPFNEDFEYLYVTDMRSTMGKHCALIFTDSVSWLSKKRCPKRCRVYVIPGVHLAINDLFKNEFEWNQIAISEMWHSRQNNCKEICHRHKHNANHIIRNLIISKSPLPKMD